MKKDPRIFIEHIGEDSKNRVISATKKLYLHLSFNRKRAECGLSIAQAGNIAGKTKYVIRGTDYLGVKSLARYLGM